MKNQKGITLVALVITIIVLLILAGVSISLVVGNNGVLTQASNSVVVNKAAAARQSLLMAQAAVETYHYAQWSGNTAVVRKDDDPIKGTYSHATSGLAAQLLNEGYTVGTFSGTTFTGQSSDSAVQAIIGTSGAQLALKNASGEIFVFSNVAINENTGALTFGSGATLTVYNSSGVQQGYVNL